MFTERRMIYRCSMCGATVLTPYLPLEGIDTDPMTATRPWSTEYHKKEHHCFVEGSGAIAPHELSEPGSEVYGVLQFVGLQYR